MMTDMYRGRIIELFKSGAATPEQWGILADCVMIASFEDSPDEKERAGIKQLEDAIGFTAHREKMWAEEDARFLPERAARDAAALAAAKSEDEKMQVMRRHLMATDRKAEQASNRKWGSTLRKLGIDGGKRGATCARPARKQSVSR